MILRFAGGPSLFIGTANDAKVAPSALPPVWGGGKKCSGEGVANGLSNFHGRGARFLIESDCVLDEAASRGAKIKAPRRDISLAGEQLFSGESIEHRLE
jgi:hypothetical protein